MQSTAIAHHLLEEQLGAEWPWLVRLCARAAGSGEAAEDLAQETMLEAWRQRERLRDAAGLRPWLAAIARFVCLRWRRRQGRELARLQPAGAREDDDAAGSPIDDLPDAADLPALLERHELLELLDRALALLPAESRTLLIGRYVEEFPHAEMAARLRVSEGAIAMRLQRSKAALRRVLGAELRAEAAAYGLVGEPEDASKELRVWCPFCGDGRLRCRREPDGERTFWCPLCAAAGLATQVVSARLPVAEQGRIQLKTVLGHALAACHQLYRAALASRETVCWACGGALPVAVRADDEAGYGVSIRCRRCALDDITDAHYLALDLPETRAFWRDHPRMRLLPPTRLEAGGRAALLVSFERSDGAARIDVLSAVDTLDVLDIRRSDQGGRR
ncbi:MAG TPA: RNA polymerase sigma factor [Herpetosiphonaceae bacterium]